jgi:hypothetical protein
MAKAVVKPVPQFKAGRTVAVFTEGRGGEHTHTVQGSELRGFYYLARIVAWHPNGGVGKINIGTRYEQTLNVSGACYLVKDTFGYIGEQLIRPEFICSVADFLSRYPQGVIGSGYQDVVAVEVDGEELLTDDTLLIDLSPVPDSGKTLRLAETYDEDEAFVDLEEEDDDEAGEAFVDVDEEAPVVFMDPSYGV